MSSHRRRALMGGGIPLLTSDNPATICPVCGGSSNSDETYHNVFSVGVKYCAICEGFTEHYHCSSGDDSTCDTTWCTVCGRYPCPYCGSARVSYKTYKCVYNYHDIYECYCSDCMNTLYIIDPLGPDGDHVDCGEGDDDDEGGGGSTPPPSNPSCPECGLPTERYGSGICDYDCMGESVTSYRCPECGTIFCGTCGSIW